MRIALLSAWVIVLGLALSFVVNLPQNVGLDVPDGKLNSLSFAPFREGQNPLLLQFPTPEQIDEDLALMAQKTHTIRTYSSTAGMSVIPELAQKHGLLMIQGAWIGYDKKASQLEIDALVEAANRYPDVVKRVMVGNEVLLRGERTSDDLIAYIRQVKQRVQQPVSYADVWSMYMKHPELIKEVDYITIHILPYWEDEPISVEDAPAHIERIYQQVQKEAEAIAPGKPILIGETGWPAAGRQRGWAVPSVVNEAAFIRALLKIAADNHFDVNIVEAFNQSWKSELEGVIGANWGLYSIDRQEVFPLTGKVRENLKWLDQYVMASLVFILGGLLIGEKIKPFPNVKAFYCLVFMQLLCVVLVYQSDKAWHTSYTDWQRVLAVAVVVLNLIAVILLVQRATDILGGKVSGKQLTYALQALYLVVLILMLYKTYLLAVEGRYVSFPFELTAVATLGLVGLYGLDGMKHGFTLANFNFTRLIGEIPEIGRQSYQIGWLLLFYAFGLVIGEIKAFMVGRDFIQSYPELTERLGWAVIYTFSNGQLLLWLATLFIVAWSLMNRNRLE